MFAFNLNYFKIIQTAKQNITFALDGILDSCSAIEQTPNDSKVKRTEF